MSARLAAIMLAAATLAGCVSSTEGTPGGSPPTTSPAVPSSSPATPTPVTSAPLTSSSAPPSSSTRPVPAQPLRTKTVTAQDGTVYAISVWAETDTKNCAGHAYGQVAGFLATHPCFGLHQLLATTAIEGRAVGFAQNSIGFTGGLRQSYNAAGEFTKLVTRNGTGNLDDLLREGYRLPAGPDEVPSPDAFRALGQDAGVVVVDAWYLDGPTPDNDPPLVKMAEDIFLQF